MIRIYRIANFLLRTSLTRTLRNFLSNFQCKKFGIEIFVFFSSLQFIKYITNVGTRLLHTDVGTRFHGSDPRIRFLNNSFSALYCHALSINMHVSIRGVQNPFRPKNPPDPLPGK